MRSSPPAASVAPFVLADPDIVEVLIELVLVDHRPDLRAGLQRVVDDEAFHALGDRVDEAVVDAVRHDEARRRRAALAGREERAVDGALDRHLEVGVVEYHQRVLAAHFELHLLHRIGADAGLRDLAPGRNRAGKRDGVDVRVVQHRLADDEPRPIDEIEHAGGNAGAHDDLRRAHGPKPAPGRPA